MRFSVINFRRIARMQTSSDPQLQTEPELIETASLGDRLLAFFIAISRHVALLAAWIALSGSLFFSEVLGWPPCSLCWYQRILMYPLAVILAIGIFRRDRGLHLYVLPLALVGACVSLYHYLLIRTDWFPPPPCSNGIPCTVDYLNVLGFINIPFLALTAFLIISLMMALSVAGYSQDAEIAADSEPDSPIAERTMIGLSIPTIAALLVIVVVVSTFLFLA
jgi:disulfide bond formation protein DsbB